MTPQQKLNKLLKHEYTTHIPTPTQPITHTYNPTTQTYTITAGHETITLQPNNPTWHKAQKQQNKIQRQTLLKQFAKHTNDKHILKHINQTIKHIQQDTQQHGPHQGLLHPNHRTP